MVQMRKWKRGGEEEEKADPGGPTKGILSGGRSQGQCGEHPPPTHTHTQQLWEKGKNPKDASWLWDAIALLLLQH